MKKRFRIIKQGYADEYGDVKNYKYYIEEYHPIFWLFSFIPLPIPYFTEIKDGPYGRYSSRLKFDTFNEAELFIEAVLEKNKPRSTTVSIVEKEISC